MVLQGGAMRGVISAGAMIPMEALGFTEMEPPKVELPPALVAPLAARRI